MIVNDVKVMTSEERKEIIELLVANGFWRSMLLACTDKQLSKKLRLYRQENIMA
jgi:hypothetical protein